MTRSLHRDIQKARFYLYQWRTMMETILLAKVFYRNYMTRSQIAFKYTDQSGRVDASTNPNGSCENIAGILNAQKNVLGLMPHPENATDCNLGGTDGRPLFQSLVDAIT